MRMQVELLAQDVQNDQLLSQYKMVIGWYRIKKFKNFCYTSKILNPFKKIGLLAGSGN